MALPAFSEWRTAGGILVSDSLGTRAVRRTYDPSEQTFNAPLVARDAFLAGNDLLYLGNFISNGSPSSYATIVETMQFFAQKYREDLAFAERVDQSVMRILALKYQLYPDFSIDSVLPDTNDLAPIGQDHQLIFEIGRQAATLFSPSASELAAVLPEPPGQFEQIVFITDSYTVQQCSQCSPQQAVSANMFAEAVLNLYGPAAGNQITAANLSSFSFTQLTRTLDGNIEGEDPLRSNLARAEWVVIGLGKEDASRADSLALSRLLDERIDMLQNKKVIVFALNAPYYLDATDITKVSAYYGLYGKSEEMADVAARLLFQEMNARGASPVSVAGIGYDLIEATAPNPDLEFPLTITRILPAPTPTAESTQPPLNALATPTEPPTFQAGDLLSLQAGPILDHNGHIVPDNTPVLFTINLTAEQNLIQRQISEVTRQGVATATYSIEDEGTLRLSAASGDPAAQSAALEFDVAGINLEGLALQATQTAQSILATQASQAPQATAGELGGPQLPSGRTDLVDWFLLVLISAASALFAYQTGINLGRVRWAVRWGLTTLIGGLLTGSYLTFDLPGSQAVLMFTGKWGLVLTVLAGAGLGWLAGFAWRELLKRRSA
jgi:beta-N-acetylhexosaminidase